MSSILFTNGTIVCEDQLLPGGQVEVEGPVISAVHAGSGASSAAGPSVKPLQDYLEETERTPPLTREEERHLAQRVQSGDAEARDRLVGANLRLVVQIARDYQDKGPPLEDLIEEGNLGLLRALEGFDPSTGTAFSTHASYWVRQAIQRALGRSRKPAEVIDLDGGYLVPGFVDIHVHGGSGSDFMDCTEEAFRTICRAHARHGTTSLLPTTTVARHEQHLKFLEICRKLKGEGRGEQQAGARVLGAHFYGPYFSREMRGAHPAGPLRPPDPAEYQQYLAYDCISTATVSPDLHGAEGFVRACRERGICCNVGHSMATFEQMAAAVDWGVRHIDHLFCAMSDKTRLRQTQTYPMRGGVLEATFYFDELTTEVIADGKHLQSELLLLAYKLKGPQRLALCTDCNRALDMPDGEYLMGPLDGGEPIFRRDDVGIMPDGLALASSVMGMDHMVRTFHRMTGIPLVETVRMASLTPARIAGRGADIGSIAVGKLADLVVLDRELQVRRVFIAGQAFCG